MLIFAVSGKLFDLLRSYGFTSLTNLRKIFNTIGKLMNKQTPNHSIILILHRVYMLLQILVSFYYTTQSIRFCCAMPVLVLLASFGTKRRCRTHYNVYNINGCSWDCDLRWILLFTSRYSRSFCWIGIRNNQHNGSNSRFRKSYASCLSNSKRK